jgi:hypothetical protein
MALCAKLFLMTAQSPTLSLLSRADRVSSAAADFTLSAPRGDALSWLASGRVRLIPACRVRTFGHPVTQDTALSASISPKTPVIPHIPANFTSASALISFDQFLPSPLAPARNKPLHTCGDSLSNPFKDQITRFKKRINMEKHELTRFNNISRPGGGALPTFYFLPLNGDQL